MGRDVGIGVEKEMEAYICAVVDTGLGKCTKGMATGVGTSMGRGTHRPGHTCGQMQV